MKIYFLNVLIHSIVNFLFLMNKFLDGMNKNFKKKIVNKFSKNTKKFSKVKIILK